MIVVKFPGGELAVGVEGAFDFDETCWAEISPGEFFFPCPDKFDGPVDGFG